MVQEMQDTSSGAAVAAAHASMPALPPSKTDPAYAAVAGSSANSGSAVAGCGAPGAIDMGTVRKAMAWRVKYRIEGKPGQLKRRLPLGMLGVHPKNRGGIYPKET